MQNRNPILVLILACFTLGLYGIYWLVSTKNEINQLGAKIPTGWLTIIPIANLYFLYKYAEGFTTLIKKTGSTISWFLFFVFLAPIAMAFAQAEMNKFVRTST